MEYWDKDSIQVINIYSNQTIRTITLEIGKMQICDEQLIDRRKSYYNELMRYFDHVLRLLDIATTKTKVMSSMFRL